MSPRCPPGGVYFAALVSRLTIAWTFNDPRRFEFMATCARTPERKGP